MIDFVAGPSSYKAVDPRGPGLRQSQWLLSCRGLSIFKLLSAILVKCDHRQIYICKFWHNFGTLTSHTVSHVTLLVSSGKFMSGSAFFLSPPENKKAKFAFCTLKRKGGSTQKQPFLTVRFRGALLTKSVTLEFSQDTVWSVTLLKWLLILLLLYEQPLILDK